MFEDFTHTDAPNLSALEGPDVEQRRVLLSLINTPSQLMAMTDSPIGRKNFRKICLDNNGIFLLDENHPLYQFIMVDDLYRGEPLEIDGKRAEYMEGANGLGYYFVDDTDNLIQIYYGMRIVVAPEIPLNASSELRNIDSFYISKIGNSPIKDYLSDVYYRSDELGRQLLMDSAYTGEDLSAPAVRTLSQSLASEGFLGELENHGWQSGPALLVLSNQPETMLLMDKSPNGVIERIRKYTVSTSKRGIGRGDGYTPPGVARLGFDYSIQPTGEFLYDKTDIENFPVGTVFKDQGIKPRITEYSPGHHAVMSTRVMKLYGLEPSNRHMIDHYIHGTNVERLLGTPASGGCIRMSNIDVIELTHLLPENGVLLNILTPADSQRISPFLDKSS